MDEKSNPDRVIVLYDGVCGLCNRLNQFLLRRDARDRFRFAPLQGAFARDVLTRHGHDASGLDTVYVITRPGTPSEQVLSKSAAVLAALRTLGRGWRVLAWARILPTSLLDACYDFVARHRYRWFGKHDVCVLPRPEQQHKFLD